MNHVVRNPLRSNSFCSRCAGDLAGDDPHKCAAIVGGEQLIVKKAVKNVAYQDLELALLTCGGQGFSLHSE